VYLSGSTLYGSVTFNSDVTVTVTWYDKDCVQHTKTEVIKKDKTINVKFVNGKPVTVDSIPPGATKLCGGHFDLPVSGTVGDFSQCPCKKAIGATQTKPGAQ
jgi:hypothetical protein